MKFLLTNDDGITAPGLQALEAAARELGEVVVVAPLGHYSGCGHRVTTHGPVRVEHHGPGRVGVDGTPADCVRLALCDLAPDVDWVLSGVNLGGNLGVDVFHSGTVAAVREALFYGRPGIALSHYVKKELPLDWGRAAAWVLPVLRDLLARPPLAGALWNVNLPHLAADAETPAVVHCPLEVGPLPLRYRREGDAYRYDGNYHQRQRTPGADVDVCFGGRVAVTAVKLCGL